MVRSPRLLPTPPELVHAATNAQSAVQAVAFWAGVTLSLVHVPLLLLVDHGRIVDVELLVGLVAINAVACVIGHDHDPSRSN